MENVKAVLQALEKASKEVSTVFSLCLICRVDEQTDTIPARKIVDELGYDVDHTSAKTNLGLGRPRYEDRVKEGKV